MCSSEHLSSALANDHAGGHRVASCHAWHDRSIRDAKIVDSIDFERAIHHTHGVPPHFGRRCLMPKAKRCVADVVFQFWAVQVARHDLSLDKRTKSAGVAYLATKFYTREYGLSIVSVTEIIRFNLNGIGGIGTGKADTATTLGLNDVTDKGPTTRRKAKFCCVAGASTTCKIWESGLPKPASLFQYMTAHGARLGGSDSEQSRRQQIAVWS